MGRTLGPGSRRTGPARGAAPPGGRWAGGRRPDGRGGRGGAGAQSAAVPARPEERPLLEVGGQVDAVRHGAGGRAEVVERAGEGGPVRAAADLILARVFRNPGAGAAGG